MIYSDKSLSQKIERTEARANADFVETRARLEPMMGAKWIEVAGAYAMFDGPESPCTQTFGLGLFEEITADHLDDIEQFFQTRGAPVFHEVSPMADASLVQLLTTRGYQPIEFSSVMYSEVRVPPSGGSSELPSGIGAMTTAVANEASESGHLKAGLKTRITADDEAELWARTSAAGWSTEMEGLEDFMLGFGRISARCQGAYPFLAELDGNAVATGALFIYDEVCVLAGASTIPEARNQGAQNALLAARLKFAADGGCRLAIMAALPGSQSQKNAQKNGFNIAYTRTKWHLSV
jgi:hypothetical protein